MSNRKQPTQVRGTLKKDTCIVTERDQIRQLVKERDAAENKLRRVRDWLCFAANSEGGIVAEIDEVLRGQP